MVSLQIFSCVPKFVSPVVLNLCPIISISEVYGVQILLFILTGSCSIVCFFMCLIIFDYLLENVFVGVHCKVMCLIYRSWHLLWGTLPGGTTPIKLGHVYRNTNTYESKSGVYLPVTSFKNLFSLSSSILLNIQTFLFQYLSGYRLLWKKWLSFLGLSIFKAFKNIFYQIYFFDFSENVHLNNLAYHFNTPDMTVDPLIIWIITFSERPFVSTESKIAPLITLYHSILYCFLRTT